MAEVVEQRIRAFKSNLKSSSTVDVIRKQFLHGDCYSLTDVQYFELKKEVASHFGLHPTEILVVGSGKLGFSIAPQKLYRPFRDESDTDIVLVSTRLFDQIWQDVHRYWRTGGYWERQQQFEHCLFRGWIRPDKLPPSKLFQTANEWWEFFRRITERGDYGPFKLTGALYRSWYYFESYQEKCIDNCKKELKGAW